MDKFEPSVLVYIPISEVWKLKVSGEYPSKWMATPFDLSTDTVRRPVIGVNVTIDYFIEMVAVIKKAEEDADDLPF